MKNINEDESVSVVDLVNDLIKVCRKYNVQDLFESYIFRFIKDMREQGLIINDKDK